MSWGKCSFIQALYQGSEKENRRVGEQSKDGGILTEELARESVSDQCVQMPGELFV